MRRIEYSTRFRKDFKRYLKQADKLKKILAAVEMLKTGNEMPPAMCPHKLSGNYAGYMEMHIGGDLLLIWIERSKSGDEIIKLVRLGSHSELFGK